MRPASLSWAIVSCLPSSLIMMSSATPIPTGSDTLTSSYDGVQLMSRSPPNPSTLPFFLPFITHGPHQHTIRRLLSGFQEGDLECLKTHGAPALAASMAEFVGPEKSQKWNQEHFLIPLWLFATRLVEAVKYHWEAEATWYALELGDTTFEYYPGLKVWGKERMNQGLGP